MADLNVRDVKVIEGNSGAFQIEFTVFLDSPATANTTFSYYFQERSADGRDDFDLEAGTLTISAGQTSVVVNTEIFGDTLIEGDELFDLVVLPGQNASIAGGAAALRATATIADDDDGNSDTGIGLGANGTPIFGPASASATLPTARISNVSQFEKDSGFEQVRFLVTLDQPATAPVTITWYTQDRSAGGASNDFQPDSGTVTIPAGQQSAWIETEIYGDTLIEGNESFQLIATSITNAVFEGNAAALAATATIIDDDGGAPTTNAGIGAPAVAIAAPPSASASLPTLTVRDVRVFEGDSSFEQARFLVLLDRPATTTVTGRYFFEDGTASRGQGDFDDESGTFTIQAGQQAIWIDTEVYGDTLAEGSETFNLVLTQLQNAVFQGNASAISATGTIIDDDSGTAAQIGGYGLPGTRIDGPASADPTLPTVRVQNVGVIEGDSSFEFARFLVTLDKPATSPVTLRYFFQDVSASAAQDDYDAEDSTITIPAGASSAWISTEVFGDALNEGNESFQLVVWDASNAVFENDAPVLVATATVIDDDGGASSSGGGTGGVGSGLDAPDSASTTLPTLDVRGVKVIEGDSGFESAYFLLVLDRPATSTVSGKFFFVDGTASDALNDYAGTDGSFTIAAGQQALWIRASITGDSAIEGDETFRIVLTGLNNAVFAEGAPALFADATIIDDDGASLSQFGGIEDYGDVFVPPAPTGGAVPTIRVNETRVIEGDSGSEESFLLVTLDQPAPTTVTLRYQLNDGTESTNSGSGTLTIQAGQSSAYVPLFIGGDTAINGDRAFSVVFFDAENAVFEYGAPAAEATFTILDNDGGPVSGPGGIDEPVSVIQSPARVGGNLTLLPVATSIIEGNSSSDEAYVYLLLSEAPTTTVTVDYTTIAGTATAGSDYFAETGTVTFQPGQRSAAISISVQGDTAIEGDEAFLVQLTNFTGGGFANGASTQAVGVAIRGDDGNGTAGTIDAGPQFARVGIVPTEMRDLLLGSNLDDTVNLLAGNDDYQGFGGDDTVVGGDGNDRILGGDGDDTLDGNAGNDTLQGNAGNDVLSGGAGSDRLFGQDGNDTLSGASEDDFIYGGNGNDTIFGGGGDDTISGNPGLDTINGEAGNDTIFGGGDADTINGGSGNDTLFGQAGNDVIFGSLGNDTLNGGGGNDSLQGSVGADRLIGSAGNDVLRGEDDNDNLNGGSGSDSLLGGDGDDILNGGLGNDILRGGAGVDAIRGGSQDDILFGEGGNDRFIFDNGWGDDTLRDFANNGVEKIDFRNIAAIDSIADLTITDTANGALIEYGANSILLTGIAAAQLDASDFLFSG